MCSRDAEFTLTPQFKPTLNPTFDSIRFCHNESVKISVQAIEKAAYSLLRKETNSFQTIEESVSAMSLSIAESGEYMVMVLSHGCEYTSPVMKAIRIPADSAYLPNIITPNGDNFNDAFEVISQGIDDYSLRIYNRYGVEIHNGNRSTANWAGEENSGVYFWHLSYFAGCENKTRHLKGVLHVMK
jgi:gliding motility-associated-like protein